MTKPCYKTHNRVCVEEDKDCPETLGEVLLWIEEMIKKYGADTEIRLETPRWEDEGHSISLYQYRPKTESELKKMEELEKRQAVLRENHERVLLAELQKKYGQQ